MKHIQRMRMSQKNTRIAEKIAPNAAAVGLFAMLLAFAVTVTAQEEEKTLVLRQDLLQTIAKVEVYGIHSVSVMPDTADYIQVVTSGRLLQADSLGMPLKSMQMSGNTLVVPASFPYRNGINVHTTAKRLSVSTYDDSHLWLVGGSDTLRFEFLRLDAKGHSELMVPHPVVADQALLSSSDYAVLRYRHVDSPDLNRTVSGESRNEQMGVDDQEEAFQFRISPRIHRMFGGFSIGFLGWSQSPFGGMAPPMGDYAMNVSAPDVPGMGLFDVSLGWNVFRLPHWDFGIGMGTTAEYYSFPRLMGTTFDPVSGLTHLGPVDEPEYYNRPRFEGQKRVWSSRLSAATVSVPIRVEWHRRLDYKGLRLSAELRPAVSLHKSSAAILSQCTRTDVADANGMYIDVITDTIGHLYNRFRCDLRFDIGWSHLSFFVQGSLTPLFHTDRKDGGPAIDTPLYPLSMGIKLHY